MRQLLLACLVATILAVADGCGCANNAREEARRQYIDKLKSYVPADVLPTVPEDFYTYPGFRDWWRFPLVYPYSIHTIDDLERGRLCRHSRGQRIAHAEEKHLQIADLTHLTFDGSFMIARVDSNPPPPFRHAGDALEPASWIVFRFETGTFDRFASEAEAISSAKEQGFAGSTKLESVETHHNRCFR